MSLNLTQIINKYLRIKNVNSDIVISERFDITSKWIGSIGKSHLGFFCAERFPNGDIHAVFRASTSHAGNSGKLYHTKSTDEGKIWSEPDLVYDPGSGKDTRDPRILIDPLGFVYLSFFEYLVNGATSPVKIWRAAINYETMEFPSSWTELSFQPRTYSRCHTGLISVSKGQFILPIYAGDDGSNWDLYIYRSKIGASGSNLSDYELIYNTTGGGYDETTIYAIPYNNNSGVRLIALIRENKQMYSDDNGSNWIDKGSITNITKLTGGPLLFSASGRVFLITRNSSDRGLDSPLWLMELNQENNIYEPITLLEHRGSGYPSVIPSNDGFYMFYALERGSSARSFMRRVRLI